MARMVSVGELAADAPDCGSAVLAKPKSSTLTTPSCVTFTSLSSDTMRYTSLYLGLGATMRVLR